MNFIRCWKQVLAGQHRTSERMMLEAEIIRSGKPAERIDGSE